MSRLIKAQQPSVVPTRLALVGEMPGDDEMRTGLVYTGKAGRVLNGGLATAEILREEIYIGNVFEEQPPAGIERWLRDPVRLADARARLNEELAAVSPTVIVPMGAHAVFALSDITANISRVRGSPFLSPGPVMPGTKMLATFQPAYILRQWKMLTVFINDLMRAAAEAELGPGIVYPWREFTLEPSLAEIEQWVGTGTLVDSRGRTFPALSSADMVSVDIETGWGQITCIALAPDEEHAICIPFVDTRKPSKSYWDTAAEEAAAWRHVKGVLTNRRLPKLGQNYTYDAVWLLQAMGIRTMNYRHDTRLMHHALLPELPKDLAFMAAAYTGKQWKHWGKHEDKRDE